MIEKALSTLLFFLLFEILLLRISCSETLFSAILPFKLSFSLIATLVLLSCRAVPLLFFFPSLNNLFSYKVMKMLRIKAIASPQIKGERIESVVFTTFQTGSILIKATRTIIAIITIFKICLVFSLSSFIFKLLSQDIFLCSKFLCSILLTKAYNLILAQFYS